MTPRVVLREPLLHFVVLGGLLHGFGFASGLSPGGLLAVLAVGMLGGQSGKPSARWAAISLPLAWGAAALAGLALGTTAALGWLLQGAS